MYTRFFFSKFFEGDLNITKEKKLKKHVWRRTRPAGRFSHQLGCMIAIVGAAGPRRHGHTASDDIQ